MYLHVVNQFLTFSNTRSSRKNVSSSSNQSDSAHPLRTSSQPTTSSSSPSMPHSSSSTSSILVPSSSFSSSSSPPAPNKKQLAYARTKTAHGKPFKSPPTKPRKHRATQRSKEAPGSLSPKSWKSVPARVVSRHELHVQCVQCAVVQCVCVYLRSLDIHEYI